mmetsp:Transcript_76654/g.248118  ORF Transcript_76654/g.248118 Transcript_76654/m.248118 type:complete len:377 (-) Transcript_76654:308-1438(-)
MSMVRGISNERRKAKATSHRGAASKRPTRRTAGRAIGNPSATEVIPHPYGPPIASSDLAGSAPICKHSNRYPFGALSTLKRSVRSQQREGITQRRARTPQGPSSTQEREGIFDLSTPSEGPHSEHRQRDAQEEGGDRPHHRLRELHDGFVMHLISPPLRRPLAMHHRRGLHPAHIVAHDASLQGLVQIVERGLGPIAIRLRHQHVRATRELQPTRAPPISAPAVADNPILQARMRLAPASHLHDVIHIGLIHDRVRHVDAFVPDCDLRVVQHELSVRGEAARKGPPRVDLLHHGHLAREVTIVLHAIPYPILHCEAAVLSREAIAADIARFAAHIPRLVRHTALIRHFVRMQVLVDDPRVAAEATRRRQGGVRMLM